MSFNGLPSKETQGGELVPYCNRSGGLGSSGTETRLKDSYRYTSAPPGPQSGSSKNAPKMFR
jgi:hypothetical protein